MTSIELSKVTDYNYWHVRGDITALLPEPDLTWFHHSQLDQDGFIARTGTTEYLVLDKPDSSVQQQLQHLAETESIFMFPRDDAVFKLDGDWPRLLLQICSYDFSKAYPGQYITAAMAGISCWFKVDEDHEQSVLLGCDPGYAQYLFEQLEQTIVA